jgi:PAS domain S-box-containing protein
MVNGRLIREIHTQEEKFSKAFHSSPYSIAVTRLADGHFQEINDGFLKIMGYRYDEVIGKTTVDLKLWENDENRKCVIFERFYPITRG